MNLPPFLLDQWIAAYEFATPPIRYNLASSTGPAWTYGELAALGGGDFSCALAATAISYVPPEGTPALRQAIAKAHGVDPDWVVVTTGASEALSVLYCWAAQAGASIALPDPGFPAFSVMAGAWGLAATTYRLEAQSGFAQTAELVLTAVTGKTRLVLVNSPHNPTGSIMPAAEITQLASALSDRGIPLIVDEVYHPLYFGNRAPSATALPDTIVVGDFSKALSLSGLRIGWLIDRNARRREQLLNLRSYFTLCGSPVTESLAVHALTHRQTVLARLESVAGANLARLDGFMDVHRDTIGWVRPNGGTVGFPWRLDGRDARPMCEALARAGVLVGPGECFDAPSHFRVGFGAQRTGFREALDIASRVLDSQRSSIG